MRVWLFLIAPVLVCLAPSSGRADIPTLDAAQLDQRSGAAGAKLKLIPIVANHARADQGVHCAATTGQKGSLANTTPTPAPAIGAAAVRSSAPAVPTIVSPTSTGATLAVQDQGAESAGVASSAAADQQAIAAGSGALGAQAAQVGTSPTIMAAFDANSSARAQQGLIFNNVLGALIGVAQAYNVANMASIQLASQSALSLAYPNPDAANGTPTSLCPAGESGAGTLESPCAAKNPCAVASSTCLEQRAIDSAGKVIFLLTSLQDANRSLNAAGARAQH